MSAAAALPVDAPVDAVAADRIDADIQRYAQLTDAGPGVTRLAYTALERRAHESFAEDMRRLGLDVRVDAAGNTIAELAPSVREPLPGAIGTGSHLDSVVAAGRFDGIAGVVAAQEVARVMAASDLPRYRPWRFVAFAGEEGARFGQACNGSRAAAGLVAAADLSALTDRDGVSLSEAMSAVGLCPQDVGKARWLPADWAAFVELHIEQGGVLEQRGLPVGVVDAISGSTRMMVHVDGTATHSGTTPMYLRHDALVAAAECVLHCDAVARDSTHHGTRITVGRLQVRPGQVTTIAGRVDFSVDVRDIDAERQRRTARDLAEAFAAIAADRGSTARVETIGDTAPVLLPTWLGDLLREAAHAEAVPAATMASGASHDSQQINRVTPTGMIFVPSRGGLSHVPDEYTSAEELAVGTRVLLRALVRLDRVV